MPAIGLDEINRVVCMVQRIYPPSSASRCFSCESFVNHLYMLGYCDLAFSDKVPIFSKIVRHFGTTAGLLLIKSLIELFVLFAAGLSGSSL